MRIKDIPSYLRPREKALLKGVGALSTNELLALLIGSGTKEKSAIDIADELLSSYHSLRTLAKLDTQEFTKVKGLKTARALILSASFELARRTLEETEQWKYSDAKSIFNHFDKIKNLDHETLRIVVLNKKKEVIKEKELFRGSLESIEISTKEIIREVLLMNAKFFFIVHNHPEGKAIPSHQDLLVTMKLYEEAVKQGLVLIDHVIITNEDFYSFHEDGIF